MSYKLDQDTHLAILEAEEPPEYDYEWERYELERQLEEESNSNYSYDFNYLYDTYDYPDESVSEYPDDEQYYPDERPDDEQYYPDEHPDDEHPDDEQYYPDERPDDKHPDNEQYYPDEPDQNFKEVILKEITIPVKEWMCGLINCGVITDPNSTEYKEAYDRVLQRQLNIYLRKIQQYLRKK